MFSTEEMEASLAADAGALANARTFAQIAGYSVVSWERSVRFFYASPFVDSC